MKFLATVIFIYMYVPLISLAQELQTDSLKLEDLAPPSAPAFVLLDAAPNSIGKPTTNKAFATSVVNLINQSGAAVEVTPFWFVKHKTMTSFKYMGIKRKDDGSLSTSPFAPARLVALSLAVVNKNNTTVRTDGLRSVSNIALGIRTRLVQVNSKKTNEKYIAAHSKITTAQREEILNFDFPQNFNALSDIEKQVILKPLNDKFTARIKPELDSIKSVISQKPKFILEIAGAGNFGFDSTKLGSGSFNRLGAWLNLDWIPIQNNDKSAYLHIIGLIRGIINDKSGGILEYNKAQNLFDYGVRFELELRRFSFGVEHIQRDNKTFQELSTKRTAGTLKYRVTNDIYLNGTFGSNFDKSNSLLTLFGIQWNVSGGNELVKAK